MSTTTLPGAGVDDAELTAIESAVRADEAAFLADLERLVNTDCGSYTPDGVDLIGQFVASFMTAHGATVRLVPDPAGRLAQTVIGTWDGKHGTPGGPRVLLIGHMDTVFDPGTAAERPFTIDADGIAHGPGVTDMKSGLLAGLYAVRTLVGPGREPGAPLPFERLTYVANPDEEIGSPSSTPHIREIAAESDVCLVLECARANGDIVSSRKGILDARITVQGRAAHAGVEPEKGRSAVLAAADLVARFHSLNDRWDGVTVNVGVIEGGTRPNVVAERCTLQVDMRAVRRADLEAVEAEVRSIIAGPLAVPDVSAELEEMARWWPMEKLERSGRLVDHAQALARRLGFEVRDAATGGASDANTTSGMGVASIDGLGPIGGNDHSPAEYLEVASIVPRTALLAGLLLAIGRDPVVGEWRAAGPMPTGS
ncbi:MAG TPA: M20 family metallopeptidase [Candidatus Limnocylindrales bacterium]|nr:M20 family metallopeptidase [Candidatus Limnocylindrales bacterium]